MSFPSKYQGTPANSTKDQAVGASLLHQLITSVGLPREISDCRGYIDKEDKEKRHESVESRKKQRRTKKSRKKKIEKMDRKSILFEQRGARHFQVGASL